MLIVTQVTAKRPIANKHE